MSQYTVSFMPGGSSTVDTLTSNTGGAVPPTGGNINVVGDGVLLTGAGNPGTSTITYSVVNGANGQLIIGGGASAAWATLTPGTGISILNGANSIQISATASGFSWFDVTGGSATLAAESGYIADAAGLTTFTMPTNNSIGDTIKIVGKGSGGWKIVYGAGQNIVYGSSTTTTTTGNLASTNAHDCVELVCTTASATAPIFTGVNSIGNLAVT